MKHSYTLEEFKKAVEDSYSISQALVKLGVLPKGGNYRVFKRFQKLYIVDTSHFTGQGHLKGKTHNYTLKPLDEILVENSDYPSHALRKRLIKENVKEHKCECCGLTKWLGDDISLELDHIDGNPHNNTLINLRVICPNCHSKTPTYRGKNKKAKRTSSKHLHTCSRCSSQMKTKSKTTLCKACYDISQRKVDRPNKEQLIVELSHNSYVAVARKYGVSDNAIRKWLR